MAALICCRLHRRMRWVLRCGFRIPEINRVLELAHTAPQHRFGIPFSRCSI